MLCPRERKEGQVCVFSVFVFCDNLPTISRIYKFCILETSVVGWNFCWCKSKLCCCFSFTFTGKEAFTSKVQGGQCPFWNDPLRYMQALLSLARVIRWGVSGKMLFTSWPIYGKNPNVVNKYGLAKTEECLAEWGWRSGQVRAWSCWDFPCDRPYLSVFSDVLFYRGPWHIYCFDSICRFVHLSLSLHKSRVFGGVSACSGTVNSVLVFLFLSVVASGDFCSAKLG